MRVALGQEPHEGGEGLDAVEPAGRFHQARGALKVKRLECEVAEVLVEAGAPGRHHRFAGLEDGLLGPRAAAADEAEMPAMAACHQLDDRLVSPCRRVPMMMPSSLQSMASLAPF
jgi:hypothetical protein